MKELLMSKQKQGNHFIFKCTLVLLSCILILSGCRLAGTTGEVQIITRAESEAKESSLLTNSSATSPMEVNTTSERAEYMICEIKGQVYSPGIYDLAIGSRVSDLIKRSGGVLDQGSLDWVNQARKLSDGEVVVIPMLGTTRAEYEAMQLGIPIQSATPSESGNSNKSPSLVNINTASESELTTIPGIGPVTAQNIINYRTEQGPFMVLEDLKKVNRIGDKTFEKLKPYISIGP